MGVISTRKYPAIEIRAPNLKGLASTSNIDIQVTQERIY